MGVFTMPSLGADMEAGTLVEWLKAPGDDVEHGDIIAVVETDKGAIEVEVFEGGPITELLVEPGSKVPVGSAMARIGDGEGEDTSPAEPSTSPGEARHAHVAPAPAPAAQIVARETVEPRTAGLRASPAARKRAEDLTIDLSGLVGSGPSGAILLEDVEAAGSVPAETRTPDPEPMRRAIAAAMTRSKRDIPHYYLSHRFDISAGIDWIDDYNAVRSAPDRLLLGVLLTKAVALAMREFPEFNGHNDATGFSSSADVHVGNAIAIRGGGLAAPAIRNTDRLTLPDLMIRFRDLIARTKGGQFRSSEISDATITISSLGERGVESVLPIIYPPQVAIIGFGSVANAPWPVGDALAVRPVITATLAGDHRVNDGHRGALLLRRIEDLLVIPENL